MCLQQDLMDPEALKGETRPPKFMRCHNCGNRGHKAAECTSKGAWQIHVYLHYTYMHVYLRETKCTKSALA